MAAVEKLTNTGSKSLYTDLDHHHTAKELESGVCETEDWLRPLVQEERLAATVGCLQEERLQVQVELFLKSLRLYPWSWIVVAVSKEW